MTYTEAKVIAERDGPPAAEDLAAGCPRSIAVQRAWDRLERERRERAAVERRSTFRRVV